MDFVYGRNSSLKEDIYSLWFQHSEWTMMAFTAVVFENENKEETIERLLQNPVDFGDFLRHFFGDEAALEFCKLLTEHLELAVELVEVTISEDTDRADEINKRLFENADEISYLLSTLSPYWHYECWQTMFYMHLDLAIGMAGELIEGNYEKNIEIYDMFEAEVMEMANMMIRGIVC